MAQLSDTIINGDLRVLGETYTNNNIATGEERPSGRLRDGKIEYIRNIKGSDLSIPAKQYLYIDQPFNFWNFDIVKFEGAFSMKDLWQGPLPSYCSNDKLLWVNVNTMGNRLIINNCADTENITNFNFTLDIYYTKK